MVESASGLNQTEFDVNNDSLLNRDDINVWVKGLFGSWIGDANLDHVFNSVDLVQVLASGKFQAVVVRT
jgi:hypothetical protein